MSRTALVLFLILSSQSVINGRLTRAARPDWKTLDAKPDGWFRGDQGRKTTGNVLSNQSSRGDWPKGIDTAQTFYQGDPSKIEGTFDNSATVDELRYLARAYGATDEPACARAVVRGIDHILKSQYPTGGWPQYAPPGKGYHRHITFNDDTMINLLNLVREVGGSTRFAFIDEGRKGKARAAFDAGIACILKCQVVVDGKKTAWCAQHDEKTLEPRGGRTFEPVSLSGAESEGILSLLMSIDRPGPEVVDSVNMGIQWFKSVKLSGIRQAEIAGDKVIVDDPSAPPLWARFYEIGTNRPLFCSRDGVVHYQLSEISFERRNGYAWFGDRAKWVLDEYDAWTSRISNQVIRLNR